MGTEAMEVLLVEDNPADARLLIESLKDAGPGAFRITHVTRLSAAVDALGRDGADVVALDLSLPDSTGLSTVERVQAAAPGVPVVILTGLQDEALALQAVRQGVQDYLVKGQGEGGLAARALRYAVERRRSEAALHESEKRLRAVLEHLPVGVWFSDLTGKPLYVNPAAREIWGGVRHVEMQDYGQYKGWRADTGEPLRPDDWAMARALRTGEVTAGEVVEIEAFDGTRKTIRTAGVPIRDAAGKVSGAVVINEDVTERRRTEQAVRESEARLVSLFEALPVGVAIMNADGELVVSNREMDRYLPSGLIPSRDEARAWRWRGTDPDGRPLDRADYPGARAIRGERVVPGVEFRYTQDDGSEVWTQVSAVPLLGADGRITGNVVVVNDVDALKRTEEELRRAHEFSESLIETARSIVLVLDAEGRIVRYNPYFEGLTGRRLEDVRGKSWVDTFLPERDRQPIRALFGHALTVERTSGNVNPVVTKDGRERDIEWFDAPLTNARGELVGLLCTGQDITERKAAEERLREGMARLAAVVDTAVDAIITIDERGIIDSVNPATERLFGYGRDRMVGQNVKLLMSEPYRGEHDGYLRRYLRTGEARIIGIGREVVGLRKDGSTVPLNLSVSEFSLGGRRMFTGILHDVTERRRLERQVLDISSAEQRRIGQDLHDGLCQELVGVAFATKLLAGRLQSKVPDEATSARDVAALVDGAIDQARALAHGLSPVELQGGDLAAALAALALKVSGLFQVVCQCRCDQRVVLVDGSTATHLYRIAQEAIGNAVKHGRAGEIEVALTSSDAWITLAVKDDGRGIPAVLPATAGIGLSTMSYRARVIGASFSVQPGPGRGTVVTCVLPRHAAQGTAAAEGNQTTRKRGGAGRRSSRSQQPTPAPLKS